MRRRDTTWYEELRGRYRPEDLRIILIAESPPDPGSAERRFFYAPRLTHDNLYRGVADALYGDEPSFDLRAKRAVLDRISADGYWLIDAVEHPINRDSRSARRAAIKAATPALVERCQDHDPRRGVIICHAEVYKAAASPLRQADIAVLHDEPLPFPLGNWRAKFVRGFRQALQRGSPSADDDDKRLP